MFSDILVELVHTKGVTMYELSQKTDIPQSLLSNYKNGKKKPALENIIKLADFFGVSTDYLLGRTDNPNISGNYINGDNSVQAIRTGNGNMTINTGNKSEKEIDPTTEEFIKIFCNLDFEDKFEVMQLLMQKRGEKK